MDIKGNERCKGEHETDTELIFERAIGIRVLDPLYLANMVGTRVRIGAFRNVRIYLEM